MPTGASGTPVSFPSTRSCRANGYVHYSPTWNDDTPDEAPAGRGEVHELFGADDSVEIALWQYVLDIDLVTRWRANGRPIDDPIRLAANDVRAVRVRAIEDEQWVRLVDVDRSLSNRAYRRVDESVIVAVTDPQVPANNRSWRVTSDGAEITGDRADVTVGVTALSALYLGGRSWAVLASLGDVDVATPGAPATADSLFGIDRAPFCGTFF